MRTAHLLCCSPGPVCPSQGPLHGDGQQETQPHTPGLEGQVRQSSGMLGSGGGEVLMHAFFLLCFPSQILLTFARALATPGCLCDRVTLTLLPKGPDLLFILHLLNHDSYSGLFISIWRGSP